MISGLSAVIGEEYIMLFMSHPTPKEYRRLLMDRMGSASRHQNLPGGIVDAPATDSADSVQDPYDRGDL